MQGASLVKLRKMIILVCVNIKPDAKTPLNSFYDKITRTIYRLCLDHY